MRSVSCSWVCRRERGQQFSRELSKWLGARLSFPNDFYGQECAFAFFPPFLLRLFHNNSSVSKVMGLNALALWAVCFPKGDRTGIFVVLVWGHTGTPLR